MQYIIPFIFQCLSKSDLEYFVFSTINIYSHLFVVILDLFVCFFDKQRTFLPKGSDNIHIFSKINATKYYVEHEIYANQNFSATDMWKASAEVSPLVACTSLGPISKNSGLPKLLRRVARTSLGPINNTNDFVFSTHSGFH